MDPRDVHEQSTLGRAGQLGKWQNQTLYKDSFTFQHFSDMVSPERKGSSKKGVWRNCSDIYRGTNVSFWLKKKKR